MGQPSERTDAVHPHSLAVQRNWLIVAATTKDSHRTDLWLIPAEQRFTTRQFGRVERLAELALPVRVFSKVAGQPLTGPLHALTRELVSKIRELADRDDMTERWLVESLTTALRLHLIEIFTSRPQADNDAFDDAARERLLEYIDRDVDTSQEALAHHVGMSVRAFARAFAVTYRTTPHQLVLDRRIDRAKTLLRTTNRPVTEIGLDVGFSTPSHFSTAFKNRIGVTPTQYREGPDRPALRAGRSVGRPGNASLPPIRRTRP
ncbi:MULTISPECIES: helix-turn-helix transcriptional regulator [unclassified Mycolicibacterium]|uniref:helix-turn-helix transcriptional regulator n=1 Tax=unclassified Mycolicibacterium TaxID=2636767 RepID=UPI0012DCBBF3|nr:MULTISPECIES: helix-turn-helix transcriptional regulator [unclassified Mycolicibacterium]MUL81946.1 helix-turn-helix transcriptional regulator [Mycolicibacterium sp. CBMA 329]MUL87712.1 helix-turn-helix transcriptional regulator [Mycolicibacterium sp. CBMA 331]MUL99425.1 helix-turn-helix transcriptional regulator [Mycolicibacterium sp. CBMA 334]MUM29437.1 helix-turn-helix transcriptional regulator [Mycolicibacterium sp. CBMA 295]MUM38009.1 helix-turn-helix transcriptional regulator [Mycolic